MNDLTTAQSRDATLRPILQATLRNFDLTNIPSDSSLWKLAQQFGNPATLPIQANQTIKGTGDYSQVLTFDKPESQVTDLTSFSSHSEAQINNSAQSSNDTTAFTSSTDVASKQTEASLEHSVTGEDPNKGKYAHLYQNDTTCLEATGLDTTEFEQVFIPFEKHYRGPGPHNDLYNDTLLPTLRDRLFFASNEAKTGDMQTVLATRFGMSISSAHRRKHAFRPLLQKALGDLGNNLSDRQQILAQQLADL